MMLSSYKVEILEYTLGDNSIIYKIVEKHYFIGIMMSKEEHPNIMRDLEYAKGVAEKISKKLFKEYSRDIISKKTVYTIKG